MTNPVCADQLIFGPGVVLENRRQSSRMWRPLGYFFKLGFAPRKGLKILRDFAMSCGRSLVRLSQRKMRVFVIIFILFFFNLGRRSTS